MAYKPMWDWLDVAEGKKKGSSYEALQKERVRQGYKRENHIHRYISTWQGWVCSECGKAKSGKTLKGELQII